MKKIFAFVILAILAFSQNASANFAPVYGGNLINRSTTALTTASLTVLAANSARKYFFIENISSVNVCCNPFGTAICGTAPTNIIIPNGTWAMSGNFVYTGALNCIAASGSGNNVVIYEGQ